MVSHTEVLGPFVRCAIWLQGCNRNCAGCISTQTRELAGGITVSIDKVFNKILSLDDIEGITVSGGEPFLQIESLHQLLKMVRDKTQLGIIIYTGYYLDELKAFNDTRVDEIISDLADIIIDGPYIEELNDEKGLRGSSNQTVHFLTDRYQTFESVYKEGHRKAEVLVNEKELFFIGVPDRKTLDAWQKLQSNE